MSDIERSIRGWRKSLVEREGVRAEHADELEDHLREEIARLKSAALTEQEMFLVASERLGRPAALAAELERADPVAVWRKRWIWMLCGYTALTVATGLIWQGRFVVEWLTRSQSQIAVLSASVATCVLGFVIVFLVARRVSRTASSAGNSTWSRILDRPRNIACLAVVALGLHWYSMYGSWYFLRYFSWREGDSRLEWGSTSMWTIRVLEAFVPVLALCALAWRELRRNPDEDGPEPVASRGLERAGAVAVEQDHADVTTVWRRRWIWMLCGYLLLNIAFRLIMSAQSVGQWFLRKQSLPIVSGATLAMFALGIVAVILLARWSIRARATSEASVWWRNFGKPRGILGLALSGLLIEWLLVYGTWLGFRQLEWSPGDTRAYFVDWLGVTITLIISAVPVAALCALLWRDRRRERADTRAERAEA